MEIMWLGQGGFRIRSGSATLCVDLYLSDIVEQLQGVHRICGWLPSLEQVKADYYFCTHAHMDHFDPVTIPQVFAAYPDCVVSGPQSVVDKCAEHGLDLSRVVLAQSEYRLGPFTIKTTPAQHSDPDSVGIVLECEGRRVYISGDSEFMPQLAQRVQEIAGGAIDAAFICINGKLGNMDYQQAAEVIDALRPSRVCPMHYGMFAENTVDPQLFVAEMNKRGTDLEVLVMEEGNPFTV